MKKALLIIYVFGITTVHATALNPAPKKGIVILGVTHYSAEQQFNNDRKKNDFNENGSFKKQEINYFLQHGLNENLALVAMGTIFSELESSDNTTSRKNTATGDQEVGLKYQYFTSEKKIRSWQLTTSFPTYSRTGNPLPGNHQHNVELRHLWDFYQTSFFDFHSIEFAYRLRFDQPADLLRIDYTNGKNFGKNLVLLHAFFAYSMKNHQGQNNNTNPNINSDYDDLKIGASYVRYLKKNLRAQFGYLRDIWGRNIGVGNTVFLNIWYEY